MTFTFSNNEAVDYPALGMCDTCGKRFTQGCEHSNTLEAQQWLAAYLAVEQNRDNVEYFLETQKDNQPAAVAAYEAERLDDMQTDYKGRKFSPSREAETRKWWNDHFSPEKVRARLEEGYRKATPLDEDEDEDEVPYGLSFRETVF